MDVCGFYTEKSSKNAGIRENCWDLNQSAQIDD